MAENIQECSIELAACEAEASRFADDHRMVQIAQVASNSFTLAITLNASAT